MMRNISRQTDSFKQNQLKIKVRAAITQPNNRTNINMYMHTFYEVFKTQ